MSLKTFIHLNIRYHLVLAFLLRLALIVYGNFQDQWLSVPYTDVDYKVFTDAARHVYNGNSPYNRHTYRYSPLLAYIMLPSISSPTFGKQLFSAFDILVGLLIYYIVSYNIREYEKYQIEYLKKNDGTLHLEDNRANLNQTRRKLRRKSQQREIFKANASALLWLYNPVVFVISTRGNCDAIAGLLVLSTLYFLQCKRSPLVAGLLHGFSIHFRLYPLMYSLTLYAHLSKFSFYSSNRNEIEKIQGAAGVNVERNGKKKKCKSLSASISNDVGFLMKTKETIKRNVFKREHLSFLLPNFDQLKLMLGTLITLSTLTGVFYFIYGYTFLYETYLYHLVRKDARHNFSLYFYIQYLTVGVDVGYWQRILTVLPQYTLILVLSVRYGLNKISFNFALLTITIVMVTFNTVLTSQYFTWIMVILPLCVWQIKMSGKLIFVLIFAWIISQVAWLLPAYLLEFEGQNTFIFIWIQSVSLFCANIGMLGRVIAYFMPTK